MMEIEINIITGHGESGKLYIQLGITRVRADRDKRKKSHHNEICTKNTLDTLVAVFKENCRKLKGDTRCDVNVTLILHSAMNGYRCVF